MGCAGSFHPRRRRASRRKTCRHTVHLDGLVLGDSALSAPALATDTALAPSCCQPSRDSDSLFVSRKNWKGIGIVLSLCLHSRLAVGCIVVAQELRNMGTILYLVALHWWTPPADAFRTQHFTLHAVNQGCLGLSLSYALAHPFPTSMLPQRCM